MGPAVARRRGLEGPKIFLNQPSQEPELEARTSGQRHYEYRRATGSRDAVQAHAGIGYRRAAGNTPGEQIKYGCQRAIVPAAWRRTSASTPLAKSLPMAVVAASASVACAWADTSSKHTSVVPSSPSL
jgi:hypothetical protein